MSCGDWETLIGLGCNSRYFIEKELKSTRDTQVSYGFTSTYGRYTVLVSDPSESLGSLNSANH